MLRSIFAFISVASAFHASAQPAVDWITGGGGAKNDKTRAICFDRAGNVFLAGELTGDGKFGTREVKCAGAMDFVLAKVDASGNFLWARTVGGQLTDRGYGVATDSAGNAYVTGHFESTDAQMDGKPLPNAGDYDIFVAKYDAEGKLLWIRTAGGPGYDYGHGIAIDGNGDVVVTGAIVGTATFGKMTAGGEGRPIFCAKYDAQGTLKWVKTTSGKVSGSGHGVAVDAANNIYIGGSASGEGLFDDRPMKSTGAFAAKLDAQGAAQWVTPTAGGGAHEITADAQGRVWLAGMFKGKIKIGDTEYTSGGDKDNDGFIAHLTKDGKITWSQVIQSPAVDYCLGVATDGNGTAFVCGEFSGTATFAGQTLTSHGATDIQIGALDEGGKLLWLTQVGGAKGDNAYTMAFHPESGDLAIGGAFTGPATFGAKKAPVTGAADLYGLKMRVK